MSAFTPGALRRPEAAAWLGVSEDSFARYVKAEVPSVRIGSVRVYPVAGLQAYLDRHARVVADDVA